MPLSVELSLPWPSMAPLCGSSPPAPLRGSSAPAPLRSRLHQQGASAWQRWLQGSFGASSASCCRVDLHQGQQNAFGSYCTEKETEAGTSPGGDSVHDSRGQGMMSWFVPREGEACDKYEAWVGKVARGHPRPVQLILRVEPRTSRARARPDAWTCRPIGHPVRGSLSGNTGTALRGPLGNLKPTAGPRAAAGSRSRIMSSGRLSFVRGLQRIPGDAVGFS